MPTKPTAISAAFLVVVNAVVTLLASLGSIHWSDAQTATVYLVANTGSAVVLALYFHLSPGTKKQPVAIAGSFTAFATAAAGLVAAFQWVHLTDAQLAVVGTTITAIVSLVVTMFARDQVTAPVTPPAVVPAPNVPGGNDGPGAFDPPLPK